MTNYEEGGTLLASLQAIYGFSAHNENGLLDQLAEARILERGPRWRFQHDLFEEYFAASRIVSLVEEGQRVALSAWSEDSVGDVANIIDFIEQFASPAVLDALLKSALPKPWRDRLSFQNNAQKETGELI